MAKSEHQLMLITSLRAFTGAIHAIYASQMEFFIISLHDMAEHLINLQKETLKEACERFIKELDSGGVTGETTEKFTDTLDKLISGRDFQMVYASMIAGKELIRKRLSALKPLSLIGIERKTCPVDMDAERRIRETYARLKFDPLVKKAGSSRNSLVIDAALIKARAEVKEYCCLYRVPLNETNTLTPFSLSCVDAMIAASYRFLSNFRKAMGPGIEKRPGF